MFTSMVEEGAAETAAMMNALADQSVARARELLLTYRADVAGPSTSPRGEPPAFRSGNLRAAIGHEEPKPGDYGTFSVLIGPRPGFRTGYGTHREASPYGGYLEHEQDHPFLKRAVREATALHRARARRSRAAAYNDRLAVAITRGVGTRWCTIQWGREKGASSPRFRFGSILN